MHQLPLDATLYPVPACLDTRLASHVDGAVEAAVVVSAKNSNSCRQCRLPPGRGDRDPEEVDEEVDDDDERRTIICRRRFSTSLYPVRDSRMWVCLSLQRPQRPQRGLLLLLLA